MSDKPSDTVFSKIIRRELPADIVYEDEICICFKDIMPVAPVHLLLVPKKCIPRLSDATTSDSELLGHLMSKVGVIAKLQGIDDAFRVVVNNGAGACQTVFHLHLHIIAGRAMSWPPG